MSINVNFGQFIQDTKLVYNAHQIRHFMSDIDNCIVGS